MLSKTHDKPFFAALGIRKPHMSWVVPDAYCRRFPLDRIVYPLGALDTERTTLATNADVADLGGAGRATLSQFPTDHLKVAAAGKWKALIRAYLACVAEADDAIGVAMKGVLDGPNVSNTIIVIWSDHGWQLGEKLAWRKFTLWERALRVPVIFAGPRIAQRSENALFSTIDLYKTLCDLAGVDQPADLDGVSHAAFLTRKNGKDARDSVVSTWALETGSPPQAGKAAKNAHLKDIHFSVRRASARLIAYGTGERELYDHKTDPWEWRNIAGQPGSKAAIDRLIAACPRDAVAPAWEKSEVVDD